MKRAGVVGLGLMGGSLARELAATGWSVAGADRDRHALEAAIAEGVVHTPLDVGAVDLLVLAVPVRAAPECLRRVAPRLAAEAVITDVGSTKRSILKAACGLGLGDRFVGSHPVAGDHRSGWLAGRTGLFTDRIVWICPGQADEAPLAAVESMWRSLGARPGRISADDHDRLVAYASHLPQLLASALAATLDLETIAPELLGPGGRDMTRLAASDAGMWTDILLDNADMVAPALYALQETLNGALAALRSGDHAAIRSALLQGRHWTKTDSPG